MSDWKNVQYKDGKFQTSTGGGGGGSSTFAGLDDVDFSNLQNGQVPKYNSTTQKWENANESGGGGTVTDVEVDGVSVVNQQGVAEITMPTPPSVPDELSDLSDVQFSNLTDHQPLRYNAVSQKWVNGADNYPPLIYSDEEREVGVWRDGKPLYQKSFKFLNSVNFDNGKVFDTNITDMDFGFIKNAIFYDYGQNRYEIVPFYQTINTNQDPTSYMQVGVQSNTGKIVLRTNASWSANNNRYLIVTLLYTKTTDTAGSGTWTTQGGYAHHYSTTEQVVGTWIDGKPIYEKSWDFDSYILVNPNTITSFASKGVMLSDVDYFVNAILISKVDKRVCNTFTVGYFSGNIGVYNPTNADEAIDKVVLQYTKTTD